MSLDVILVKDVLHRTRPICKIHNLSMNEKLFKMVNDMRWRNKIYEFLLMAYHSLI